MSQWGLCCFQSFRWQVRPQYVANWHRIHARTGISCLPQPLQVPMGIFSVCVGEKRKERSSSMQQGEWFDHARFCSNLDQKPSGLRDGRQKTCCVTCVSTGRPHSNNDSWYVEYTCIVLFMLPYRWKICSAICTGSAITQEAFLILRFFMKHY